MKHHLPRAFVRYSLLLLLASLSLAASASAQIPAPVAASDSYVVSNPSSRFMGPKGVLANDTLPRGNVPIAAAVVAPPKHGRLTLQPTGEFTYAPHDGYYGSDSFTYKVVAGGLESKAVTVNLVVQYVAKSVLYVPVHAVAPNHSTQEYVEINGTIKYTGVTTWNYRGTYPVWYLTRHEWAGGTARGLTSGTHYTVTVDPANHDEAVTAPPFDWYRLRPVSLRHTPTGKVMRLALAHKLRVIGDGTTTAPAISDSNLFFKSSLPRRAYVTNPGAGTVTVVATQTDKIVKTISVGTEPDGIAMSQTSNFVYVANSGSDTVSVIRVVGNDVVATIPVGSEPRRVAVNPLGTRVYVSNSGSDSVSVINTATNTVMETIDSAKGFNGSAPSGLAVNGRGTRLYVASRGSNTISVIDTSSDTVVKTIHLPGSPGEVAVKPGGDRVCVTLPALNSVAVIDASTNAITGIVPVGVSPDGIAFRPLGDWLYVTNGGDGTITVMDLATHSVVSTIESGVGPGQFGLGISNNGLEAYVTSSGAGVLEKIKIHNSHLVRVVNRVIAFAPAGASPSRVALLY